MSRARDIASHGYTSTNANILINPSFTVQQRGAVIDHAIATYGPDRWKVRGLSDVGGTVARSSTVLDATTGVNKMKVENTGATSYSYTFQRVEAANLYGLYGSEITFSFGYSDSGSGDPVVNINSFDGSGVAKEIFGYAVPTDLGGGRWSCTFTLSTEDGTFPDLSDLALSLVIYPNEKNTAPSEWYVWETKLEAGSEVTPFVARPYGEELALCKRYFWKMGDTGSSTNLMVGSQETTSSGSSTATLPVTMRAVPSITLGAGIRWYTPATGAVVVTSFINRSSADVGCVFPNGIGTSGVSGQAASLYDSNVDGYILWDAEL